MAQERTRATRLRGAYACAPPPMASYPIWASRARNTPDDSERDSDAADSNDGDEDTGPTGSCDSELGSETEAFCHCSSKRFDGTVANEGGASGRERAQDAALVSHAPTSPARDQAAPIGFRRGDDPKQRENAWTSSKTWTSEEEAERQRWAEIDANMARYGFNKSPYRPRDVNEWKAVTAATMDWKFDTGIEWLERAMQHHLEIDRSLKAGVPVAQLAGFFTDVQSALGQASGSSGLSPVLSRPSMWAATPSLSANGDWPERGRLKKAGPARARVGKWRLLPLPGTKRVDDDPVSLATEPGVPLSEPGVPGAFRRPADWAVRGVRFDCLMEHEEAEVDKPVQELELSEVNETIGSFIEGIDDFAAM